MHRPADFGVLRRFSSYRFVAGGAAIVGIRIADKTIDTRIPYQESEAKDQARKRKPDVIDYQEIIVPGGGPLAQRG
jgi:hypothetical protein